MKNKIVYLALILLVQPAFAVDKHIHVKVSGMVCAFCAQGITKKFKSEKAVSAVDVQLSDKEVNLKLKEGQDIADDKIKEILTDSGYTVEMIERK
jgi:copper chaperone CopZ